jgi:hypothetical protein
MNIPVRISSTCEEEFLTTVVLTESKYRQYASNLETSTRAPVISEVKPEKSFRIGRELDAMVCWEVARRNKWE